MRRLITPLVLCALAVSCRVVSEERDWVRQGDEWPLHTGPYILLGEPGTAYVAMKARGGERPVVEWWPTTARRQDDAALDSIRQQGKRVEQATLEPSDRPEDVNEVRRVECGVEEDFLVARLTGLPTDRPIAYRVLVGDKTTETFRFRAGVGKGEPFRFAVFGDTRTRHSVHAAVIDAVDREEVDFLVHTGDMVHRGGVKELWDLFFQIERPLLVDTPIFPSIGNHDWSRRGYYERYFLLDEISRGRRYYSYDFGNVRLVALDGGIEGREGSRQYAFADRALAEAVKRGMFTMLYLHWPPYSSGKHGSQLDVREPIQELASRHGVELVITGHDHIYERTIPIQGTTYVVSGSAGAPTRNVGKSWFTAHVRTEPHYMLVDVESDKMTIRAVNLAGNVFDSAVLADNPPGGRPTEREVAAQ